MGRRVFDAMTPRGPYRSVAGVSESRSRARVLRAAMRLSLRFGCARAQGRASPTQRRALERGDERDAPSDAEAACSLGGVDADGSVGGSAVSRGAFRAVARSSTSMDLVSPPLGARTRPSGAHTRPLARW
eukprot:6204728-Pleurochrysis_carterae.AAC.2